MSHRPSRRDFLRAAVLAGTAVPATRLLATERPGPETSRSAHERLNLAIIGVGGRGADNLAAVSTENIVALCDIDAARLAQAAAQYPSAKQYHDYRHVFEHTNLDGVVVSTPDHTHAVVVSAALRNRLAVYCEKPLTHSVHEARYIRELAGQSRCVTQMGNQIHNDPSGNYRRVVETIGAGVLGPVRRVHVWMIGVDHFVAGKRVAEGTPPPGIHYDQWLGPAPYRPFHPSHFHFNWRYWWDFGGGQLADFWCHYCDLPFWALQLEHPTSVHATGVKGHDGDNDCPKHMQVEYQFPARGTLPPVHLTWYHGGLVPDWTKAYEQHSAVLFEGETGRLLADYTTRKLFFDGGQQPAPVAPSIADSVGHHREWIEAVKAQRLDTTCNFRYGGLLTEIGLLGNVSYRAGQAQLAWDPAALRAANCPAADQFIQFPYRDGWQLA